jgi:hypothetical protein
VRREELTELHYIIPIGSVGSVLQRGILSHVRAQAVAHTSIAMQVIQERRNTVQVPGGRPLHEYVNLYICGRNPMLYVVRGQHEGLCVLRVSPDVLDLPGVVVSSGNASSGYIRFGAGAAGLEVVSKELTFAEYWTDQDVIEGYRKKCAKCAEVLVPDLVDPRYVVGAYVSGGVAMAAFTATGVPIPAQIDGHLFFH